MVGSAALAVIGAVVAIGLLTLATIIRNPYLGMWALTVVAASAVSGIHAIVVQQEDRTQSAFSLGQQAAEIRRVP